MRNRAKFLGVMAVSLGLGSGCVIDLGPDGGDTSSSSTSAGGGGTGGGTGGSGGQPTGEAPPTCAELGGATADPKHPGIDATRFAAPNDVSGCAHGFDAEANRFTLAFAGTATLSLEGGHLLANGNKCTAPDGSDVILDEATVITVSGSEGDDALLLDFSKEGAGPLGAGALAIDLSSGVDRLFIEGSDGPDAFAASESDAGLAIDSDADGDAEIRLNGLELLVASLGDGDDRFDASPAASAPAIAQVVICAGAGNDTLRGGAARDELEGGPGDDMILAAEVADGADLLDGGEGIDTADYSARSNALEIRLDGNANDGEASEFDDVRAEHVIGGAGNDTLVGSDADDILDGGPGDDAIDAGAGNDVVNGGSGDDTFAALAALDGADIFNGGEGSDEIDYSARPAGISVTLCVAPTNIGCDATCTCAADDGQANEGDNLVNVENVRGTAFSDTMIGDASSNQLFGNGGDDMLRGGYGDDSLFGDIGDDSLDGGEGDDYLDGGDGADTFEGGGGQGDICVVGIGELAPSCELY
ncbi:MAG: calcium-binding protein [Polyangiaceae bacterium]